MKKTCVVLASALAALLVAGCVSMEEYNKVAEERDIERTENDLLAEKLKAYESQAEQNKLKVADLKKGKEDAEKERDVAGARNRDLGEQLNVAKADAEKAKHELTLAQDEIKMTMAKVKDMEKKVGELTAQLAKTAADGEKAKQELQGTIDKLTMGLNDAQAQIEKLEDAAKEVKAEPAPAPVPAPKAEPEKIIESKPMDVNKAPDKTTDPKVKDTKGSKAQKQ